MTSETRYTLDEAAGKVGVRADDLPALLPNAGIDLSAPGHEDGTLSEAEFTKLADFMAKVKQYHRESPESAAD